MDEAAPRTLALPPAYTPPTFQPFSASRSRPTSGQLHPRPSHPFAHLHLPSAYFVLKSKGALALDLTSQRTEPGASVGAYPIKLPIIARGSSSLNTITNNQLFYLDWDGHLCSASANRPVDVVDFQLSLQAAGPSPIFAIASRASHPLPRFALDPITATLHVKFEYEPTFSDPPNSNTTREQWSEIDWIVEIVPSKLKRVDNRAAAVMTGLFSGIGEKFGLFGLASPPLPSPPPATDRPRSPSRPSTSANTLYVDHSDDSGDESDTDTNPFRALRVIQLPPDWREKFPAAALSRSSYNPAGLGETEAAELRKWRRRQWVSQGVSVEAVPGPASPVLQRNQIPPAGNSANLAGMRPLRLQTASTLATTPATNRSTSPSRTSPPPVPVPVPTATKESRWSTLSLPFLGQNPSTSPSKSSFAPTTESSLPPTPSPPLPLLPTSAEQDEDFFELIPRSLGDYDDARVVQEVVPVEEEAVDELEVASVEQKLAELTVPESVGQNEAIATADAEGEDEGVREKEEEKVEGNDEEEEVAAKEEAESNIAEEKEEVNSIAV